MAKITITDIARESNVSPTTVSLVLRDKPGVGKKTRQRVIDTAQSLGYLYKPSVHAMNHASVNRIGLMINARMGDEPMLNRFYSPILSGIESVCRQRNIHLLYSSLPMEDVGMPMTLPSILAGNEVDGILLVGAVLDEQMDALLYSRHKPIVLVDSYAKNIAYDTIYSDNLAGAYQAVMHLVEHGHKDIAIAGSHPYAYPSILERRNGYLQALQENGLTPYFADSFLDASQTSQAVGQLLEQQPQITAIFGCNDLAALAAMKAAQGMKRQIPQELSVIGFDNIDLAQHVSPALTTVRIDKVGMGRIATQMLLNRIEFPESGYVRTVVQGNLIVRESVRVV